LEKLTKQQETII